MILRETLHKVCNGEYLKQQCLILILVHAPENDTPEHILPRHEVITRLRERGEPILLFGESEIDSFKRLRHCEILEPEVDRVSHILNKILPSSILFIFFIN